MAIEALDLGEPSIPAFDVYDRMRKARKKASIKSLEDMAARLTEQFALSGIILTKPLVGPTVAAWERGTNQPTKLGVRWNDVMTAWAAVTRVNLSWLSYGEGTRSTCNPLSVVPAAPGATGATELELPFPPALSLVPVP